LLGALACVAALVLVLERRRTRQSRESSGDATRRESPPSRRTDQPAAELVTAWVHFVRDHVHESVGGLNNRLSAIALAVEALKRTRLSDEQHEHAEQVTHEIQRASKITSALAHRVSSDAPEIPPRAWRVLRDAAGRPARILVVEADESNRTVLARLLRALGHRVTSVVDGREAWETLSGETFDCIVCDPRLPGPGGRALFEQVEERLPHLARRFVFVTGEFTAPMMHAFLEATGRPVVGKPYELETLLQAIATVLEEVGVVADAER
jgi:CheY-like chemotaxis protein